ncbi:alcohol oxidase [Lentinula raphanica]|uniref:Alcohol oxidase n=1 Tax=Lentinula raphanica TaxID=153919 RepID=A0AA38P579_9AGAR|nr:alcohol oxidase [Lentinula raphanica]
MYMWTFVLTTLFGFSRATLITSDPSRIANSSYEFVIVGGGTTGLAVANRLAVNYTVLVIERGENFADNEILNDPFMFGAHYKTTPCTSTVISTPQLSAGGTRRRLPLYYGNCLGGSSSINGMMGARPTFASMNAIEALGNPGWGWNDFLPYMQKSETFTPPSPLQVEVGANYLAAVHGYDGPVGVSFPRPFLAPALQSIAKNTTQIVFEEVVTPSPDMGNGFSGGHFSSFYYEIHFNETLQADRRSSSAWSYLYPQTQQRAGLTVLTGHPVNSIITSDGGGNITATGVLVELTKGGRMRFNASKEVIISAGALHSPAILQRSGIGNATFLRTIGIEPILDLPGVGANVHDHVGLYNTTFPLDPSANTTNVTAGTQTLYGIVVAQPTVRNTLELKDTLLRNIFAEDTVSAGGVVNSESLATQATVIADAYRIDHPFIEIFFTPGSESLAVAAHTVLPLSRGTIRINATDPIADPVVDMRYLTTEVDVLAAIAAARRISLIAATPPFSELLAEDALEKAGVPGVNATEEEMLMSATPLLYSYISDIHFVGSNSMMRKELGGVVSPELLVYGTTNLRIADASILPLSVFPHPTLGLYGVAEKVADMILRAGPHRSSGVPSFDLYSENFV